MDCHSLPQFWRQRGGPARWGNVLAYRARRCMPKCGVQTLRPRLPFGRGFGRRACSTRPVAAGATARHRWPSTRLKPAPDAGSGRLRELHGCACGLQPVQSTASRALTSALSTSVEQALGFHQAGTGGLGGEFGHRQSRRRPGWCSARAVISAKPPPTNRRSVTVATFVQGDHAPAQQGDHRRVVFHRGQVAFVARHDDHIDGAGEDEAGGADDF